jgi:hypothetical protein
LIAARKRRPPDEPSRGDIIEGVVEFARPSRWSKRAG